MSPTDLIKKLLKASERDAEAPPPDPGALCPDNPGHQVQLQALAISEEDPALRASAIKRLRDLPTVRHCLSEDQPRAVREAAVARYSYLLKSDDWGGDLGPVLEAVRLCPDRTVLAHLAQSARLERVRREALGCLASPQACLQAALHDPVRRQRKYAVSLLEDPEALESIVARCDDRGVARLARRRLDELLESQAVEASVQEQAVALCEAMEGLGRSRWTDDLQARRQRLENQWTQLEPAPEPLLAERFERARTFCAARKAPQATEHEQTLLTALEQLAHDLTADPEPTEERLGALKCRLARSRRSWLALGADPTAEARYRTRYWRLECWCADARRFLDQHTVIAGLLDKADRLDPTDATALLRHARQLHQALRQTPWHSGFPLPELLRTAQTRVAALETAGRHAGRTRLKRLDTIRHLLADLEQAAEAGAWPRARRLIAEALNQTGAASEPAGADHYRNK
ncbi:hypothetical protein DFR31_0130 [Alkalispirillum mobile]|uniref:Uncharacterized protein n=1 Tax=Alkalispirillum mobile TaxID=85925 RepID=A0A498CB39_9GAMM|nr:hypothetical protein [Alkalispirillum mobile]RLK50240.1 hypothetical protein DFR31_0130 [Alkalispirillum mobile]